LWIMVCYSGIIRALVLSICTYSHVLAPLSQSQSFTTRENPPLAQSSSPSATLVPSQSQIYIGDSDMTMHGDSGDPDILFLLPQCNNPDLVLESEIEEVSCEEEDSEPESVDNDV